jgi:hypothetical protein
MVAVELAAISYAVADISIASLGAGITTRALAAGLVAAAGLAAPLGCAAGAVLGLLLAWGRPNGPAATVRARGGLAALVGIGAIVALSGAFLRFSATAFHDSQLIAAALILVLILATGAAALTVALLARVSSTRPLRSLLDRPLAWVAAPVLLALAAAAVIVGRGAGDSTAAWLRAALLLPVAAAVACVAHRVASRRPRRLRIAATLAALVLFALATSPLADSARLRETLWSRSTFLPRASTVYAPVLDRDGDGFTAALGGGDCDGGSPARNPAAVEERGDGIDQDCLFGDLTETAEPPRAGRPPVATAVLLSIAGLDSPGDGHTAPALPRLEVALAGALRFGRPVGLEGRFPHLAAVLMTGRLPLVLVEPASGFAWGGPSLPGAVERAGGSALAAVAGRPTFASTTASLFRDERLFTNKGDPGKVVDRALDQLRSEPARPGFVWVHLDLARASAGGVDEAAARLLAAVTARPSTIALVVALPPDKGSVAAADRARGGPLALLGAGLPAGIAPETAGLLDVYPTLLDALGLTDERALDPQGVPPAGRSLLVRAGGAAPAWTRYAITGWLGSRDRLGAAGPDGAVFYDPPARRFLARRRDGGWSPLPHDAAAPDWRAPALALLRDRVLGERRRTLNQAAARARRHQALPRDALMIPDLTIGGALEVLGWSSRDLSPDHVEVTLYLRGGELLAPDDLLAVKLRTHEKRSLPVDGALPFGSWSRGEIVAHRMLVDRRSLGRQFRMRVGVVHDGRLLQTSMPGETLVPVAVVTSP